MEKEAETGGSRQEDHSAGMRKDGRRDGESVAPTTSLKQPSGDWSLYGYFIDVLLLLVSYRCPTGTSLHPRLISGRIRPSFLFFFSPYGRFLVPRFQNLGQKLASMLALRIQSELCQIGGNLTIEVF